MICLLVASRVWVPVSLHFVQLFAEKWLAICGGVLMPCMATYVAQEEAMEMEQQGCAGTAAARP
jgi:hypothetical protein